MYCIAFTICFLHLISAAPLERIMVDMSYPYDEALQKYPTVRNFNMTVTINGTLPIGSWVQAEEIATPTHMGTHMDSPAHFSLGGLTVDQIPLSSLIGPAAVINIVEKAKEDPEAVVTVEDLRAWEDKTGQSLDGKIVLVNSGWGAKWHSKEEFMGTAEYDDATKLRFPGFGEEAAQWLVDNRNIKGMGMDTVSLDKGSSTNFPSHQIILGKGWFGLENVANVDKIPIYGATLYVFPMKIGQASGAPTRVIATYPKVVLQQ